MPIRPIDQTACLRHAAGRGMMARMEMHDVPFALQLFAAEAMAHAFAEIDAVLSR
jgi:hypothetical protein